MKNADSYSVVSLHRETPNIDPNNFLFRECKQERPYFLLRCTLVILHGKVGMT